MTMKPFHDVNNGTMEIREKSFLNTPSRHCCMQVIKFKWCTNWRPVKFSKSKLVENSYWNQDELCNVCDCKKKKIKLMREVCEVHIISFSPCQNSTLNYDSFFKDTWQEKRNLGIHLFLWGIWLSLRKNVLMQFFLQKHQDSIVKYHRKWTK